MAKKPEQPYASYTVRFYEGRIEASMQNFEALTPSKIQTSYPMIHEEWSRQRQAFMLQKRKDDIAAAKLEAENEKETTDG